MDNTISVDEAAARLGVSGQTVRRMRERGQLRGEKVVTPKGTAWRIFVDSLPVVERQQVDNAVIQHSATPDNGLALWTDLTALAKAQHERLTMLEDERAALREKVARLEAELAQKKRRWWRLLP